MAHDIKNSCSLSSNPVRSAILADGRIFRQIHDLQEYLDSFIEQTSGAEQQFHTERGCGEQSQRVLALERICKGFIQRSNESQTKLHQDLSTFTDLLLALKEETKQRDLCARKLETLQKENSNIRLSSEKQLQIQRKYIYHLEQQIKDMKLTHKQEEQAQEEIFNSLLSTVKSRNAKVEELLQQLSAQEERTNLPGSLGNAESRRSGSKADSEPMRAQESSSASPTSIRSSDAPVRRATPIRRLPSWSTSRRSSAPVFHTVLSSDTPARPLPPSLGPLALLSARAVPSLPSASLTKGPNASALLSATFACSGNGSPTSDVPLLGASGIEFKDGKRVDDYYKCAPEDFNTVQRLMLCNVHFLRGDCKYGSICKHKHTIDASITRRKDGKISEHIFKVLTKVSRTACCYNGITCDDPQCIYGHRCPAIQEAINENPSWKPKRGPDGRPFCYYGDTCKFSPEMHWI